MASSYRPLQHHRSTAQVAPRTPRPRVRQPGRKLSYVIVELWTTTRTAKQPLMQPCGVEADDVFRARPLHGLELRDSFVRAIILEVHRREDDTPDRVTPCRHRPIALSSRRGAERIRVFETVCELCSASRQEVASCREADCRLVAQATRTLLRPALARPHRRSAPLRLRRDRVAASTRRHEPPT